MAKKAKAKTSARKASSKASTSAARGFADTAKIVAKGESPYREDSVYGRAYALAVKAGNVGKYKADFAKLKDVGTAKASAILNDASSKGALKIA